MQEPTYNYLVQIINPAKRSDYVTRTWHGVHETFDSPAAIRQKLKESFSDKVPSSTDFAIGYFEKRCNAKRWIEEAADCKSMYESYKRGDTITIWCVGTQDYETPELNTSRKRKSTEEPESQTTSSRRDAHENEVDRVFQELRSTHKDKFTGPQYRVWSRMIVNKIHDSMDEPPNIPIITGEPP